MAEIQTREPSPNVTPRMSISGLAERLKAQNGAGRSWRVIAREDYQSKVPAGTLSRIALGRYEPKKPKVRKALGLPCYGQAPVCPQCGEVHVLPTDLCTKDAMGVVKIVKPRTKKRLPIREWKPLALKVAFALRETI